MIEYLRVAPAVVYHRVDLPVVIEGMFHQRIDVGRLGYRALQRDTHRSVRDMSDSR